MSQPREANPAGNAASGAARSNKDVRGNSSVPKLHSYYPLKSDFRGSNIFAKMDGPIRDKLIVMERD